MSKLKKILKKISTQLNIIDGYNKQYQMCADDEILEFRKKINDIIQTDRFDIQVINKLINDIELYYNDIPSYFKKSYFEYIDSINKDE